MNNFFGKGDFIWFVGVVEDRYDPARTGRVRVRCFGWHTDNKTDLPTKHLPLAMVMNPTSSAGISGVGQSPSGLVEGSWVVGFFLDGERAQEPIIIGSLNSIPTDYGDPDKAFTDPKGIHPRWINEPDTSKLARNDGSDPKQSSLEKFSGSTVDVPTAANEFWDEPNDDTPLENGAGKRFDPVYPYNHVYESESGHVKEYDDSPGAERIHEFHRSGTFYEIDAEGTKVERIVGKNYEIVAQDKNVLIKGVCNVTIEGSASTLIKGNHEVIIEGSLKETINGNVEREVIGAVTETYYGGFTENHLMAHNITGTMLNQTYALSTTILSAKIILNL